ncbi:hypothetical protein SAMN04488060_2286 [Qipengyuania nanhaisediminis]|uniref:Uncharacterized protein n=1 Tax=Qipengyuania nanhaisediminis TaxID=604088 RepID=A0A1I5PB49_9SPHN|nr:hypothetical protein SAMN04488060_2286 [Qipengyuania nanhaisediminis]
MFGQFATTLFYLPLSIRTRPDSLDLLTIFRRADQKTHRQAKQAYRQQE